MRPVPLEQSESMYAWFFSHKMTKILQQRLSSLSNFNSRIAHSPIFVRGFSFDRQLRKTSQILRVTSANLEPCNPGRPTSRKWWHTILERFRVFFCFWEVDLSFSVPVRHSKSNLLNTTTLSTLSVITQLAISEFQKLSLSKRGQVQNLSYENDVYLYGNKKSFSFINGFTPSLALKQRLEATWKWPIEDKNLKIVKITSGAWFQTETAVFII